MRCRGGKREQRRWFGKSIYTTSGDAQLGISSSSAVYNLMSIHSGIIRVKIVPERRVVFEGMNGRDGAVLFWLTPSLYRSSESTASSVSSNTCSR